MIEIHAAHGYLLHEFLSALEQPADGPVRREPGEPDAARRSGSPNSCGNWCRRNCPLFVRISATDWADGGWDVEQSVVLAGHLKDLGVDLIDVSSGGLVPKARIPVGKGYQVPFARKIRDEAGIMTGAVGMITEPHHADEIVTGGDADLVFVAGNCSGSRTGHSRRNKSSARNRHGQPPMAMPSSGERSSKTIQVGGPLIPMTVLLQIWP